MDRKQRIAFVICLVLPNISSGHIQLHHATIGHLLNNYVSHKPMIIETFIRLTQIVDDVDSKLEQLSDKMSRLNLDLTEIRQAELHLNFLKDEVQSAHLCANFEFQFSKEIKLIKGLLLFIISVKGKNISFHKPIEFSEFIDTFVACT